MFYWFGSQKNIIRSIPTRQPKIHQPKVIRLQKQEEHFSTNLDELFLTFDDGPDSILTTQILDLLLRFQARASFFVVGVQARKNSHLIGRMLNEGHSVFSHSIDHQYRHFFSSQKKLKKWIETSLDDLSQITGRKSLVFRPPAGVLTPPLLQIAQDLDIKLVLWSHRFYDSVWPFYQWHCKSQLPYLKRGDIVLLHDWQKKYLQSTFLKTFNFFLESLEQKKFLMNSISESEL